MSELNDKEEMYTEIDDGIKEIIANPGISGNVTKALQQKVDLLLNMFDPGL